MCFLIHLKLSSIDKKKCQAFVPFSRQLAERKRINVLGADVLKELGNINTTNNGDICNLLKWRVLHICVCIN